MRTILTDWLDEIIGVMAFFSLVALLAYAIYKGALKDEPLAVVLVILALLTPSPTQIMLKWKDFIAQRRKNNTQPDNPDTTSVNSETDLTQTE